MTSASRQGHCYEKKNDRDKLFDYVLTLDGILVTPCAAVKSVIMYFHLNHMWIILLY